MVEEVEKAYAVFLELVSKLSLAFSLCVSSTMAIVTVLLLERALSCKMPFLMAIEAHAICLASRNTCTTTRSNIFLLLLSLHLWTPLRPNT